MVVIFACPIYYTNIYSYILYNVELAGGNHSEEVYDETLSQPGIGKSTQSNRNIVDPFMRDEVLTTHKGIVREFDEDQPTNSKGNVNCILL